MKFYRSTASVAVLALNLILSVAACGGCCFADGSTVVVLMQ